MAAVCVIPLPCYPGLGGRLLYISIHNGYTWMVKALLQTNLLDVNQPFQAEIFEQLFPLELAPVIRAFGDKGLEYLASITPLSAAAAYAQFTIMDMLLKAGANINKQCAYGLIVKDGTRNKWMQDKQCFYFFGQYTLLHHACYEHNVELVKYLVDNGADINARDSSEYTPLHLAVSKYNIPKALQIVRYLLKHGATIDARTSYGYTPLFLVIDTNRKYQYQDVSSNDLFIAAEKMFKCLKNHGADFSVQCFLGESVLQEYAFSEDYHFLRAALPHCDARQTDYRGQSLLHTLCKIPDWSDLYDVIRDVLPYSDVNQTDHNGITPLYLLIMKSNIRGLNLLLEHGADATHADKMGFTPIVWSCEERVDLILRRHGCIAKHSKYNVSTEQYREARIIARDNLTSGVIQMTDIPHKVEINQTSIAALIGQTQSGFFNDTCRLREQTEALQISNTISKLVTFVGTKMGDLDPALAVGGIQLSGSVGERTKVHQPDEFDFVLELTELKKWLKTPNTRDHEHSYTQLQCKVERSLLPDYIARYFDSQGILSVKKLLMEFYKCINMVLDQHVQWSQYPHLCFYGMGGDEWDSSKQQFNYSTTKINHYYVIWHGTVYPFLCISIDIVAGIPFPGWFPAWCLTHPLLEKNGCFVVAKHSDHASQHLRNSLGRFSFSVSECKLMLEMPVALRKGYMLAKHMRHPPLCPVIQYEGKENIPVNKVISSYLLKNCIFVDYADLKGNVEPSLEKIIYYAHRIYIRLGSALRRGKLPMFFIPEQNLLSTYTGDEIRMAINYCTLIRLLLKDPCCVKGKERGKYLHWDHLL